MMTFADDIVMCSESMEQMEENLGAEVWTGKKKNQSEPQRNKIHASVDDGRQVEQ